MNKSIVQMVLDGDPQGQDFTPVQISTYDKLKAYRTSVLLGESESLELLEELFDMAFEAGKSSFVVTTKDAQRIVSWVTKLDEGELKMMPLETVASELTGWLRTL